MYNNIDDSSIWLYYFVYISMAMHLSVMYMGMNAWCNYNKLVMAYSLQFIFLHVFAWAIPDRRYSYWVKQRKNYFYWFAGTNMLLYFILMVTGSILYMYSHDGLLNFIGLSIASFQLVACTPMIIVFAQCDRLLQSDLFK